MKNHLFIALVLVAACTDQPDVVAADQQDGRADAPRTLPSGNYEFEPTLSGSPDSGEIVSLWLAPSHTFSLTVSDELSGTTMHHGTFELFDKWDDTAHYIDFTEGTQRQRFDYQIDVVDGATLWLHQGAGRWYALTSLGEL